MIFRLVLMFRLKVRSTNLNRRAPRACSGFELGEEGVERERPRGLVQRRQAELALERAAARGFDVEGAVGDVVVGDTASRACLISAIGGCTPAWTFISGFGPLQDLAAQLGEGDVAPAGDQVVGQLHDLLFGGLVRHFRPAEHDRRPPAPRA